MPESRERDAYRALLEINLLMGRWRTGQVGIDSNTGHAILSMHMPMTADTTGKDLAATLDHAIDQAGPLRAVVNPYIEDSSISR